MSRTEIRITGFGGQGVVLSSRPQRQSGTWGSKSQVVTPKAPAKWAKALSMVITRSRFCMTAAVWTKPSVPASKW